MERSGDTQYRELLQKLHGLRNRMKWNHLISSVSRSTGFFFLLTVLAVAMEALFRFSSVVRIFFTGSWIVLLIVACIWVLIIPLYSILFRKRIPEDDELALRVGERYTEVKDRLADALQVYRNRDDHPGSSSSLAILSLEKIHREIKVLDFRRASPFSSTVHSLKFLGLCAIVCSVIVFAWKGSMLEAVQRLQKPHISFSVPAPFRMIVQPGDVRIVQGEEVNLSVEILGRAPATITLHIEEDGGTGSERNLEFPFVHRIASVRTGFSYFAQAEQVLSPEYTVQVMERPVVRILQVKLHPPAYRRSGVRIMEPNAGDVEALKGSRVSVSIQSSKPLSRGTIRFQLDEEVDFVAQGTIAQGSFIVDQDDRYWVNLTDTSGLSNSDPIVYSIRLQPDFNPIARILSPARNIDLDESMEVPLVLEAEDDFGLSAARIVFQVHPGGLLDAVVESQQTDSYIAGSDEPSQVQLNTIWDLDPLKLIPEDVVSYAFEVWDNDCISGPKSARSRTYTVRFPSMFEIFEEIEKAQDDQVASLSDLIDDGKTLREEIRQIDEELKGGKELEWEERKALEQAVTKQDDLHERVEALKKDMDDIVDRLERYDLPSLETLEKYQELQSLYREIASPELLEAMKKLQEAISKVDRNQLKAAAETFKLNQENFLHAIERTLALLKRLQIEQKTDEIVKRIEDLVDRQDAVVKSLNEAGNEDKKQIADDERSVSRDTKALQEEMDDLAGRMAEVPRMPLDKLEQARSEIEEGRLMENLDVTANRIESDRFVAARASGSEAGETMGHVADMLNELRESLQER